MRLTVATNFEPDLLEALVGHPVYELLGKLPADPLGGGRASYMLAPLTKRTLAAHVRDAHRHGIRFNYLLNAACLDNREWAATTAICSTWSRAGAFAVAGNLPATSGGASSGASEPS